ncbi:MAG: undecaprenyldiphospho-muramoylpentapeptide beta-N-acetylglucosaminyltransferase [Cyclobacteriaceae bacterium]|nr:undecaprenyldiphospho-muramoylpentapeptide beta-N-acetylglucosaminyltransferase [Cyclobacteriaceae bacterium]
MDKQRPYRFIITGGGTGGHIYPAIAVANTIRDKHPETKILFVGANGKMEMQKVPEAGYNIVGLWISGIQRRITLENIFFPLKVIVSYLKARKIIKDFKPDVVIGFGGYASGPIMMAANSMNVPSIIQEQNSYAGLANKRMSKKAKKVCVAYEGMDKYFDSTKVVLTGNPVRKDIINVERKRDEAIKHFGFDENKKTILVLGGSLGARTINNAIIKDIDKIIDTDVQLIWQTGRFYYDEMKNKLIGHNTTNVRMSAFIKEMDLAYSAADVVVSRAGALSISELCLAKKPVILIPSPNVTEDHQTKNAMALMKNEAAKLIKDKNAVGQLVDEVIGLVYNEKMCQLMAYNISKMGMPNAANNIMKVAIQQIT